MQLIQKVLEEDKSSILLVPEISLTPQTVNRFIARFGADNVAVLHSKLSQGERFDQWHKIKSKKAKIVIGARSAIFAPVKDLGLIIIDEEHDSSYKADSSPRYDAKQVARFLARENNITLVYGSATPSIDTYQKAIEEKIEVIELKQRAANASLPDIHIVDLRKELASGNKSMISNMLFEEIEKNLENKKQTILFLNKRGFSSFLMCRECGHTPTCKNCNINLTYHLKDNKLKCHYCGYETNVITKCPECQSESIKHFGVGTQKLEEQIKAMFPVASTIRMDVDTVNKKNSHEEILDRFKNENIDILIGTQMVVKGHHFPNVTLVGVIAADGSLNIDDYRANEKTFQILTQVAGRAGREQEKGRVICQTYNPDNFAIECSKKQDFEEFYKTEITLRKQLKYPPFCDIIVIGINSENELELANVSKALHNFLKTKLKEEKLKIILYPPLPAPIDKVKSKFRWRIIIKCIVDDKNIQVVNDMLKEFNGYKTRHKTNVIVDVNPNSMAY